jgi:hypothetical protein
MAQQTRLCRSESLAHRKVQWEHSHDPDEILLNRWATEKHIILAASTFLTTARPLKQPVILTQIVGDARDTHVHTNLRPQLPHRLSSHRDTWPIPTKEKKPGSYYFENPTLTRTPWEEARKRRQPLSQSSRHRPGVPAHIVEQLPQCIYECIVDHLVASCETRSSVDTISLRRELLKLCLISKGWAKVAVERLYREIWLPSSVPASRRKLSMTRPKSRLHLLARTLTDAPALALLVRQLHISRVLNIELRDRNNQQRMKTFQTVLDVCTSVEILTGLPVASGSEQDDCYNSLFRQPRLAAHVWLLDLSRPSTLPATNQDRKSPMVPFIDRHSQWQWLHTLILCNKATQGSGQGLGVISSLANKLPLLKHLMVSGFSAVDFHNGTLLSLPPLLSLRLDHVRGVTDQGIEQLALSRSAFSLVSLSLIGLEVAHLRTIQAVFTGLQHLQRFRLVQDLTPALVVGTHPSSACAVLSSPTLRYLHWDTLYPGPATEALAIAIAAGHFPLLRTVKAPSDYEGHLQKLCRPISQQVLTAADMHNLNAADQDHYSRSLTQSRLQAQLRVRESRQQPSFKVVVEDQEHQVQHTHTIGAYLGDVQSKTRYSLEPDVEGASMALSTVKDVLWPEPLGQGERKVCYGTLF